MGETSGRTGGGVTVAQFVKYCCLSIWTLVVASIVTLTQLQQPGQMPGQKPEGKPNYLNSMQTPVEKQLPIPDRRRDMPGDLFLKPEEVRMAFKRRETDLPTKRTGGTRLATR